MNAIAALIGRRLAQPTSRGERSDGAHLALVFECGGMRGVVAGGFVKVLCDNGMTAVVDSVHGSSAGACAAAYFLSNQPDDGRAIYLEDICNRRVVNPYRILSRPCMVDTDHIVDDIIARKRALIADAMLREPGLFHVVTTAADTGEVNVIRDFVDRDELLLALKASLRVPGPREPGIFLRGSRHIDGGISAPIPILSAIDAGATHILVIGTQRPQDYEAVDRVSGLEAKVLEWSYGANVRSRYVAAQGPGRSPEKLAAGHAVEVLTLAREASSPLCHWHTIDRDILLRVEADAIAVGRRFFEDVTR